MVFHCCYREVGKATGIDRIEAEQRIGDVNRDTMDRYSLFNLQPDGRDLGIFDP